MKRVAFALLVAACSRHTPSTSVADVDGVSISVVALKRELARARKGADAPVVPDALLQLKRTLLEGLIDRQLLLAAAHAHGIQIGGARLERAVSRARAEHDGQPLEQWLSAEGISSGEYRDDLREQLTIDQLIADEVLARVALAAGEARAYYESELKKNPQAFDEPDKVRAAQIVVKTNEEAAALLAELKKGADFAQLARTRSLSPDARQGGDLGWFSASEMPPEIANACFALERPGQLSPVTPSAFGFHLFRLEERHVARVRTFDRSLQDTLETVLRREKGEQGQRAFLERLRAKAGIRIDEAALLAID